MPIRNKQTLEAIRDHELGETRVALTDKQEELRQRYHKAFHYLYTYRQVGQTVKQLQKEFGISLYTAYADINAAMELYGNPVNSNREAMRYLNSENQARLLQLVELEIKRKRDAGQDIVSELETASRINERIAKINRLHEADDQAFDPNRFERTQVFILNLNKDTMERYGDVVDLPVNEVELPPDQQYA